MSQRLSTLRERLATVEQQIADIAEREKLASCNCREHTLAFNVLAEDFEKEMNLSCPVHGFRRLGKVTFVRFVCSGEDPEEVEERRKEDAEMDRLRKIYTARLVEHEYQRLIKEEYDDETEEL